MLQDALKFLIIIKLRKQRMVYMRQGGMVPKNHNSGVYWVRANANSRNQSTQEGGLVNVAVCILTVLFIICALAA